MKDSPALNAHSRAVLVPLTRTQLPGGAPIIVAGPGPVEPGEAEKKEVPEAPELPSKHASEVDEVDDLLSTSQQDTTSDDGIIDDDDDDEPRGAANNDPYSNLGGAFGNYLADEPKPMQAGNHNGRHGEEDLLF